MVPWYGGPRLCKETTKIQLGRIQRMACLAIKGAMKSTLTATMEMLLNLTPLDLLIMVEVRMALYRLHIIKQPAYPKTDAGLLSIWKKVGDPILDMRSDYTTPVYHFSKIFSITIDRDFWRNKDPVLLEDALIWFTDGSRANSGTGSGIFGLRPNRSLSFPLGKFATVFKLKYMSFCNVHVKIKGLIKISRFLFSLIARLHLRHFAAQK
jgi:hypothetical protein